MASLYGNNVNEYYVGLTRKNFADRAARLAAIQTRADAEKYIAGVREKIRKIFNFPERTPLNPQVTAINHFDGFTVENLYYYSRPSYPVTANLYLPEKREGRVPGVLLVCGHSEEGKACDTYRSACIGLVLKGFAVLCIDPVEQGERKQYLGLPDNRFGLCGNHNLMGKHLALCGEWFGAWRTWDAVRGIDYMETRPEIDCKRLCVTGNSGGGTLTTWVAAADPRPAAVAPSCYVTSWKHNIENELPADIEQMPPRALEYGLEMGDFLLAQAPRDILILGQKNDFFDPRGVVETCREVRRINSFFGRDTQYFIGPCDHGFYQENREAVYRFFTSHLMGKEDGKKPIFSMPPEESTYAVRDGDIRNLAGSKYQRTLTREIGNALAANRKGLSLPELRSGLLDLLQIGMPVEAPYYRVLRERNIAEGVRRCRFALETEPGTIMSVLSLYDPRTLYHIENEGKKIRLYIPHLDSMDELNERKPAEGELLYALDYRGIGEMMPTGTDQSRKRDFFAAYESDYHYAALGMMFGRPIIGGRVYDILSAVELLASHGAEITLEAEGQGCIPALLAAVLSDKIAYVRLNNMADSYDGMLEETASKFPLSFMVPGILKITDLPELRKAVGKKLL